jgi:transmembrane sensor
MDKSRFEYLYERYLTGSLTNGEFGEWKSVLNTIEFDSELEEMIESLWSRSDLLVPDYNRTHANSIFEKIVNQNNDIVIEVRREKSAKIFSLLPKIAVAASLLIVLSGLYYYFSIPQQDFVSVDFKKDILPGKGGATLTLADGKKIRINDFLTGKISTKSGISISKTSSGKIIYAISANASDLNGHNTLATTRGEEAQVQLPDGTLVFLNASSSLDYPVNFKSHSKREVVLSGEAYFEVAKDKKHPFVVISKNQNVEVLGTHFNINSYPEEEAVKTTLLEGSVRVNNYTLKPSQQSIINKDQVKILDVNVEDVVAWKNGMFLFDDEPLIGIMRKIERWYDVEVIFDPEVNQHKRYVGGVSRYDKVSKVLEKLAMTGNIHFKIEGRRVSVMK